MFLMYHSVTVFSHSILNVNGDSSECLIAYIAISRYNDATIPQSELDQHTHGEKCKARMELLRVARMLRETHGRRRAGNEEAGNYEFERPTWGW
jgi:hypothetical protein